MINQQLPNYLVCLIVFILTLQSCVKTEKKQKSALKNIETNAIQKSFNFSSVDSTLIDIISHKRIIDLKFKHIEYNHSKSRSFKDSLTGSYLNKDFFIYCEEFRIPKSFNYSTFSEKF